MHLFCRFRGLAKHYYRGAHAVVVVYDVTDGKSFVNVPVWFRDIKSHNEESSGIIHVLVGNKVSCFAISARFETRSLMLE